MPTTASRIGQVAIEAADKVPEPALEAKLVGDEAQSLDAANENGDDDRRRGNREIVPEFADRIDERPP